MNKYYSILGLSPGAGKEEIKKAYRRLSKKYHPDMNQGSKESEEKFKEILEAYELLKDYDGHTTSAYAHDRSSTYTYHAETRTHPTDRTGRQTFYTHGTTRSSRYSTPATPDRNTLYAFMIPFVFALIRMMSCTQDTYLPATNNTFTRMEVSVDTALIRDILVKAGDTSNPFGSRPFKSQ